MTARVASQPVSIPCPLCGRETAVKETRHQSNYIRRRRVCTDYHCDGKITTAEIVHPFSNMKAGDELVVVRRSTLTALVDATHALVDSPSK